ncbi:MAG: dihydropteroate synthase [Pseudomonadota bacterium]
MRYLRPLMQVGPARPAGAVQTGWCWFTHVEVLRRDGPPEIVDVDTLTDHERACFTKTGDAPALMGILNVTPDSFSDGGQHDDITSAVEHARRLTCEGAAIIDIGGESTRPGAQTVAPAEEIARTSPVIEAIRDAGITTPISIDTRKAAVAQAALDAGATIINDVSGLTFDAALAPLCARRKVPLVVMHAQGDPTTMQNDPQYENVLLDVYDWLSARIDALVAQGIAREDITIDPGIGFGKTLHHNLALLQRLSLFHGLGVPILLGASRKRFIGTIGNAPQAADRAPGSVGVALAAASQGIQLIRAHDIADHAQAIALWRAAVAHPPT